MSIPPIDDTHITLGSHTKPPSKLNKVAKLAKKALEETLEKTEKQLSARVAKKETTLNTEIPTPIQTKPTPPKKPLPAIPYAIKDLNDLRPQQLSIGLKHGDKRFIDNLTALVTNLPKNSSDDLKQLLELDLGNGQNILELACDFGHIALVQALLDKVDERTAHTLTRKDAGENNILHKIAKNFTLSDSSRAAILQAIYLVAQSHTGQLCRLFTEPNGENIPYYALLIDCPESSALAEEIKKSPFFSPNNSGKFDS